MTAFCMGEGSLLPRFLKSVPAWGATGSASACAGRPALAEPVAPPSWQERESKNERRPACSEAALVLMALPDAAGGLRGIGEGRRYFFTWPAWISPRQAPVSVPRDSMKVLKRS